jgi:hypothetical protein
LQSLRHHHIGHGLHGGIHLLNAHRSIEDRLAARVFCREPAEQLVEEASCYLFYA